MSAAHPHPTNFQGVPPQQPQPNPNLFQPQHPSYPSEMLLQQLKAQVEFYFCPENLANDKFLQSQLNATEHLGAVPIQVICSFRKIRQIYNFATIGTHIPVDMTPPVNPYVLFLALHGSTVVSVSHDGMWIQPKTATLGEAKQDNTAATVETPTTLSSTASSPSTASSSDSNKDKNILLLREVPQDATEEVVLSAFGEFAPKSARPDGENSWSVVFETGDQATAASSASITIAGETIQASLKNSTEKGGPPAMPLPPPAANTPKMYQLSHMPPGSYPPYAGYPQYGFMPTPYSMQQIPYGMPHYYQQHQRYGGYSPQVPHPRQNKFQQPKQSDIPPPHVFVRPDTPTGNASINSNSNGKKRNNNKNKKKHRRQHSNTQQQPNHQNNSNKPREKQSNKNISKNNANDNKKQNKNNKKKDNRKIDLSAESFPALGGTKQQPKQQEGTKNSGYAQALLKKSPIGTGGKKVETSTVTAAMNDLAV